MGRGSQQASPDRKATLDCLASATAVGPPIWFDWDWEKEESGRPPPLPPRAHAGRVQLPQGRPRQTGKSPIRRSLVALAWAVMGCVKVIVVFVALTLSYPISPTVAMPSRTSTTPSRHLLSSYGILFILLTMVSKVRHTFHMAQYHFASHSRCPFCLGFAPQPSRPLSLGLAGSPVGQHLQASSVHRISPDSSLPTRPSWRCRSRQNPSLLLQGTVDGTTCVYPDVVLSAHGPRPSTPVLLW